MPFFNFEGKDQQGKSQKGVRNAKSKDDLAGMLMSEGIIPVKILEGGDSQGGFKMPSFSFKKKVTTDEIGLFARQMYTLTKSGITISAAIKNIANATQNKYFADILFDIAKSLEEGMTLSKSLSKYPEVFNTLLVTMIQIGQESGNLEEVFSRLSEYLELEKNTLKKLKSATRYPFFVICSIVVATIIINIFVIPAFADLFAGVGVELPAITKVLITVSTSIKNYWYIALGVAGVIFFGIRQYLSTPEGRYKWDKFQLKLPGIGYLIRRVTLLRFAETMSIVVSAGVPIVQGLGLVADSVTNAYAKKEIEGMQESIQRGNSMLQAAKNCPLMTAMEIQMLTISEETGELAGMLKELSQYYQSEVEYDLKKIVEIIEPFILLSVGIMVAMLALAVYLPIWNMIKLAKK